MTASSPGPVLFLMGPTATGKTDAAVWLAERLPVRVISVDSALVYRGMDIGTAKPVPEVLDRVPHHLVDIREPQAPYSAADFRADALQQIAEADRCGQLPLLVGGTMLYFRALRDGLADLPPADARVRAEIEQLAAAQGWPAVHARLAEVDPETAARLKPTDSQRLQRALEVQISTGVALSQWHRASPGVGLTRPLLQVGLLPTARDWLHARIRDRFQAMLDAGFLEEVRDLHARPELNADLPSMRCVGYRQLWRHLDGEMSLPDAIASAIAATRQLAKRQITWLRSWEGLHGIPVAEQDRPDQVARKVEHLLAG